MNFAEIFMNLGTVGLAIACIPQLIRVIQNRHDLRGFSIIGALTIFLCLICISISFAELGMLVSLIAQLVPLVNWGLTAYYAYKCRE